MLKHILNTIFTRFTSAFSNLLIAIIISNYLGPIGKGEQGLILTTISLIIIISSIIGTGSLTYLIPKHPLIVLIVPSLIWGLMLCSILSFLVLPPLQQINESYISDIFLLSFLFTVTSINQTILIANKEIVKNNLVSLFQTIFILLFLLYNILFIKELSIIIYIKSLYLGYFIGLILSICFTFKKYLKEKYKHNIKVWINALKLLAKLGIYNQLSIIIQMVNFRLGYYILNYYFGSSVVGIYSNGVSIIESIWLLSRSISLVQHSRIVSSNSISYSKFITVQLSKLNLSIIIACLIPFIILPSSIYQFVFGEEFQEVKRVTLFLIPGIISFSIYLIIGHYFSGIGKHNYNLYTSLAGLIFTFIFAFILIPNYELNGACFTASLSYFATMLASLLIFRKITNINIFFMIPKFKDFNKLMGFLNIGNKNIK